MSTDTEPNRETVRRAFAAWPEGSSLITGPVPTDMVWRIDDHSLTAPTPSALRSS